jgi:hypothetical protein
MADAVYTSVIPTDISLNCLPSGNAVSEFKIGHRHPSGTKRNVVTKTGDSVHSSALYTSI